MRYRIIRNVSDLQSTTEISVIPAAKALPSGQRSVNIDLKYGEANLRCFDEARKDASSPEFV
jgi:hypothetical protein